MRGRWWIPGSRGHGAEPGSPNAEVFIGSDYAWELMTSGSLLRLSESDADQWFAAAEGVTALYGLEGNDRHVSFLDAHLEVRSADAAKDGVAFGPGFEVWRSEWCAAGTTHVEPTTVASVVELEFDALPVWATVTERQSVLTGPTMMHFPNIDAVPAELAHTVEIEGVRASLVRRWKIINDGPPVVCEADACFRLSGAIPLQDIHDQWMLPLRRLIQFFAFYEVNLTGLTAYVEDDSGSQKVEISYATPPTTTQPAWQINAQSMLSTSEKLSKVGLVPEVAIERWMRLDREYRSAICDLLTSADPRTDPDVEVFFAHRSAESLHDKRFDGTARDPGEHQQIIQRTKEAISESSLDEDQRDWILGRLSSGNRKSQTQQLRELVEHAGSTGQLILNKKPQFVRTSIEARNRSIHANRTGDTSSVQPYWCSFAMRSMLRHIFLLELGLSEEQVHSVVSTSEAYRSLEWLLRDG